MGRMSDVHIDMQETGDSAEVCLSRAVKLARNKLERDKLKRVDKVVKNNNT